METCFRPFESVNQDSHRTQLLRDLLLLVAKTRAMNHDHQYSLSGFSTIQWLANIKSWGFFLKQ